MSPDRPRGAYPPPHCTNTTCSNNPPGWGNAPCSPPTLPDPKAANRQCNMVGNVMSGGDHDNAEKPGGTFGAPDQDRQREAVSPVIITKTAGDDSYNAMGLNSTLVKSPTNTEWAFWFDIHTAGFRGAAANGNLRSVGLQ